MCALPSRSSFIVCCAKLVFLPAVIAWQLFEEVRDKLQAKYHELQVNSSSSSSSNSSTQQVRIRLEGCLALDAFLQETSTATQAAACCMHKAQHTQKNVTTAWELSRGLPACWCNAGWPPGA
jgi:hypothetical protein